MSECSCIVQFKSQNKSIARLRAKTSIICNITQSLKVDSNIFADNHNVTNAKSQLIAKGNFTVSRTNVNFGLQGLKPNNNGYIYAKNSIDGVLLGRVSSDDSHINVIYTDKIGGSLYDIEKYRNIHCTEKLYPRKDLIINIDDSLFVDKDLSTTDLYESINEGILPSLYDDQLTYIQPSSIHTNGTFRYKCEIDPLNFKPENSLLLIRASAPMSNYISRVPPIYTLYNLQVEDPSGNLVIKYKDMVIRGDADYNNQNYVNFGTYITEPEINNATLYRWNSSYPLLGSGEVDTYFDLSASGYTFNLDLDIQCVDDPFNAGFNFGYEDTCAIGSGSYGPSPTNTLRISAIEICNSGYVRANFTEDYVPLYIEISPTGLRIERDIYVAQVLEQSVTNNIYPEENSTWISSPDLESNIYDNTSYDGTTVLTQYLREPSNTSYITLNSTSHIADSGKLKLKFSHETPKKLSQYTNGAFNIGYLADDKAFDTSIYQLLEPSDPFFTIDSIELHVIAKKAVGSRDYALDIVGYSDDHLLHITSQVGGFLQSIDGSGILPVSSGYSSIDDLGISTESISDKSQYYENTSLFNEGGDHYKLSYSPIVNTTSFAKYIIPLQIYLDNVELGKSRDYTMSSFFENLYVDIYPLPSGASIAYAALVVKYKPSDALLLHTIGSSSEELFRRNVKLYPAPRKINDLPINKGHDFAPISQIDNIPQAFTFPDTLKTNYSRRWRGVDGTVVAGPFSSLEFDFSFYNPELTYPFINGYFSFNNDQGNWIISDDMLDMPVVSGEYIGNYNRIRNIGLRFNSDSLFDEPTDYTTIDWTSIPGYENDLLYGKIADAFDNAVRVSGDAGYIDFGNLNTASGFAIFTRFSPDITISGVDYNLFNSGILFAKYDSGKNLEFSLGYNNGYLEGKARADDNTIYTVTDSLTYDNYSFPINVILVYNDGDEKLHLYTTIEHSTISTFHRLRDQSQKFTLATGDSSLIFGQSFGDGIGINAFITDIGISLTTDAGHTNIIKNEDASNKQFKEISADRFLDSIHMKFWEASESYEKDTYQLWNYVDEDPDAWHLGAFKICEFNQGYDRFTYRVGTDFLIHHLKHDGIAYENRTDITLPSNIPSGTSYHSQIENDTLRFNIGAMPESFNEALYSADVRISKNLPRGYNFKEEAFVVDTIIQYETFDDIVWPDNKVGPRLIVSLYTPNKDPELYQATNYGLINRHIHYLAPSGCWHKLSSTFDFNNLIDETSEPWSNFVQSRNITEFNHKYYSDDVDEMFLQYDLVYPSGSAFESTVKIHSSHVRLKDALIKPRNLNSNLTLNTSGDFIQFNNVNLFTNAFGVLDSVFNLHASGGLIPSFNDNINLYTYNASGESLLYNNLKLSITSIETSQEYLNLFTDSRIFTDTALSMFSDTTIEDQLSENDLVLFTYNKPIIPSELNDDVNLFLRGESILQSFVPYETLNLFTNADASPYHIDANMNLFISGDKLELIQQSLKLFTLNVPQYGISALDQQTAMWNSYNVGTDIIVRDNDYAFLDADDEIRGVETICYGDCSNTYGELCSEPDLILHGVNWKPYECVDGGIFRALRTYTNLEASGFKTEIGYSGHFYGIRKYTDLIPNAPYRITITTKTGEGGTLDLPREIEHIEYGTSNEVAYSGIKLIADAPYVPSGRQVGDEYGKSVAIKSDLLVIGAPKHTLYDSEAYELDNAGTVFVYRRNVAPTGYDWRSIEDKAGWELEATLSLPESYRRDSYYEQIEKPEGFPFHITKRYWHVGQYGREFGHSVSIAKPYSDDKEFIVVGGPGAKWDRTFEDLEPSGVNIGLFIFTDRVFQPYYSTRDFYNPVWDYNDILSAIEDKDIVFKYFSNPSVKFNVKIAICQAISDAQYISPDFPEPAPNFIIKRVISRHTSNDLLNPTLFEEKDDIIYSGIKDAFDTLFPYDTSKLHNNIPPILGFYIDDSASLGIVPLQPAIDEFVTYYQDYSFASGLKDFDGVSSSGSVNFYNSTDANWIIQSINILNDVLDTGNLFERDQFRYFTNDIGEFNSELGEFNVAPPSGGCVYIFEKENDNWNLIQTINSPTNTNLIYPDRFGHAVDISNNGEAIIIGSPYIDQALMVYEYDPLARNELYKNMPEWVTFKKNQDLSFGYYYTLYNRYVGLANAHGSLEASKILYTELTQEAMYDLRHNKEFWTDGLPQEFKNVYTYKYSDINYGSWSFLVEDVAPLSRLGYSVAINEDGSIFAAGAPTDSFNEFDEPSTYYAPARPQYTTWQSYINAGAVRVFESRKYFPHSLAIEYGKFGNRHYENMASGEAPLFEHMSSIFNDINVNFIKTEFADVDIPQEAGLAFIITPHVDALSDEILQNIQNWLALGDRNLVLVGNDPVWENNGLYGSSNDIINKILDRLGSRLRIQAARNVLESLSSEYPSGLNVLPSVRPDLSLDTYIYTSPMKCYGVGDIRVHWPENYNIDFRSTDGSLVVKSHDQANYTYDCVEDTNDPLSFSNIFGEAYTYASANGKCEMPIVHNGDLRSQWYEWCSDVIGKPIKYAVNWPLFFGTQTPASYGCDIRPIPPPLPTKDYDAVPLLVAAENAIETIIFPDIPASSGRKLIGITQIFDDIGGQFGTSPPDEISILWTANSGIFTSLETNVAQANGDGIFYDPDIYNNTDAILQAKTINDTLPTYENITISQTYFAVAEKYISKSSSQIIGVASIHTESQEFLDSGADIHRLFYINLVKKPGEISRIAQLSGWTGRESFKSGYSKSYLSTVYNEYFKSVSEGIALTENVSTTELLSGTSDGYEYDVCWIANPIGLPSSIELSKLRSWLSKGNKKLIITYGDVNDTGDSSYLYNYNYTTTNIAKQLFTMLNSTISPIWLNEKNKYAHSTIDLFVPSNKINTALEDIILNSSIYISDGISRLTKLSTGYTPLRVSPTNSTVLAYEDTEIIDVKISNFNIWRTQTGTAKLNMPAVALSGYEIFFDFVSENETENIPLNVYISNVATNPHKTSPINTLSSIPAFSTVYDQTLIIDENGNTVPKYTAVGSNIGATLIIKPLTYDGSVHTTSIKVQALNSIEDISIYINSNINYIRSPNRPRTVRLVAISGCPVEILPNPSFRDVGVWDYIVTPAVSGYEFSQEILRPISTDNTKYCPTESCISTLGNKLIADGPVIMAQELEVFSPFEQGIARSRITVLSDSSLIQGKCIADENGIINDANIRLIQSLYPPTVFPSEATGRQFNILTKIQSPERASPAIYFNANGNSGINLKFNTTTPASSGALMSSFIEAFDNYDEFKPALHPKEGKPPQYIEPREQPIPDEAVERLLKEIKTSFRSALYSYGSSSKFMGNIEGKYYEDSGPKGGVPEIMKDTGYDYLDFHRFPSGYPGDLFGYSVAFYNNKLLIGAPFVGYTSETLQSWNDVANNTNQYEQPSGTLTGFNGGAGAVYLYELTRNGITPFGYNSRWECTRKFRPDSINIGQDLTDPVLASGGTYLGPHSYTSEDLTNLSIIPDQFGHTVKICSDLIAIGAPGHDFDNAIEDIPGAFINKEFNRMFNRRERIIYNLGSSGVRNEFYGSGIAVLNNGAIFTYENVIDNWSDRSTKWQFVEKIVPQGYNSRSNSENDYFGYALALDNPHRSDSDYTIIAGTPYHKYATSGNHISSQPLIDAGAAYTYDAMLHRQLPSSAHPDTWIKGKVFGERNSSGTPYVAFNTNNSDLNMLNYFQGIIYTNYYGEIYLEASGQDFVEKGYISHRPYVVSVDGSYVFGSPSDDGVRLYTAGHPPIDSGSMNLFSRSSDSAIVYNTIGLYENAVIDIISGVPSGLSLFVDCPNPITVSDSGLYLYASGTGFSTDTLNLRIRGK